MADLGSLENGHKTSVCVSHVWQSSVHMAHYTFTCLISSYTYYAKM